MMKRLLTFLTIAIAFNSCIKKQSAPSCNFDPCGVVAPASEVQAVEQYLSANNITATKHCSGMYYRIESEGTGTGPTVCNEIAINYEGKLTNGNTFDKTSSPATFFLYQLIRGWQNGIPLIKPEGRIYLYIPPSLGYGSRQVGDIPPNSILIFQVDLLGVR